MQLTSQKKVLNEMLQIMELRRIIRQWIESKKSKQNSEEINFYCSHFEFIDINVLPDR